MLNIKVIVVEKYPFRIFLMHLQYLIKAFTRGRWRLQPPDEVYKLNKVLSTSLNCPGRARENFKLVIKWAGSNFIMRPAHFKVFTIKPELTMLSTGFKP